MFKWNWKGILNKYAVASFAVSLIAFLYGEPGGIVFSGLFFGLGTIIAFLSGLPKTLSDEDVVMFFEKIGYHKYRWNLINTTAASLVALYAVFGFQISQLLVYILSAAVAIELVLIILLVPIDIARYRVLNKKE